jgi:hypothetical protein
MKQIYQLAKEVIRLLEVTDRERDLFDVFGTLLRNGLRVIQ